MSGEWEFIDAGLSETAGVEESHEFVLVVYRHTECFPKHELYGLTSQLRRAAASIPTNIVEGCGRGSDRDQMRFFQIAMGSAFETEYLLLLTSDLGYLNAECHQSLTESLSEIKAMHRSLLQKLDRRIQTPG